jgi:hypothetical protein
MARTVTPERVMVEVERVMSRPFAWGPCDCCSAACDVFAALWGCDPMTGLRCYTGAAQAARMLAAEGGLRPWAERVARRAGLVPGHAPGGFGLAEFGGRASLLICVRPGLWAGKSLRGFALVRTVEKGWRHAENASDNNGNRGFFAGP